MRIALIQQHASLDRGSNLERGIASFRRAAAAGAEIIAFPELAFLRFFPQQQRGEGPAPWAESIPGPTTDLFCNLAREYGAVTLINLYEKRGEQTFDSSPVIDADGALLGITRMVHIMDGACFHERDYYHPGDTAAPVYETAAGRIGVAICYDRHYPEYMRALAVDGAEMVFVPQAGAEDEWPPGLFEAELQVASMQNGYFCALSNRVGQEECLTFAGGSFVTDPRGQVIARAPAGKDDILYAEIDLRLREDCPARKHFLADRRPDIYPLWKTGERMKQSDP